MLDQVPEYDQKNNSSVSELQRRRLLEQNVSKLERDLRDAVLEFKKLPKRLHTDQVELELLRTEMENNTEEIRSQEAAIRFVISNSRENAARCLATILHNRALNLTTSLVVNDSVFFSLYQPWNLWDIVMLPIHQNSTFRFSDGHQLLYVKRASNLASSMLILIS